MKTDIELTSPAASEQSRLDWYRLILSITRAILTTDLARLFASLASRVSLQGHWVVNMTDQALAKILTHVRCHMDDAKLAVDTGVDG